MPRSAVLALALTAWLAMPVVADDATSPPALAWPVPDWQVASPKSQQVSAAGLEKVRQWHEQNFGKAGLVVRHGQLIGEWYFNQAQPTDPLLVYSVTKSFSSTAVGIAIADGKLTLDTRLGQFVTNLLPAEKQQITLAQLLSMTTGVRDNPGLSAVPNLFNYAMLEAPFESQPGEKWAYRQSALEPGQ